MAPKKNYTPEQMGRALDAVRNGEKVSTAALRFGVPRVTLYNKVSGKSPAVCSMGPQTILTTDEEQILVRWLTGMSEKHFPINRLLLTESVQKIITENGRANPFTDNKPGKKWFSSFLKRHPELTERTAQNLSKSRDDVKEEDIYKWFEEITSYLQDKGLSDVLNDPNRIFNTDESAFFLSPKAGRVLCRQTEKHLYQFCGDEKDNLTVLLTANAAGQLAPPMIVFKYERVPSHIAATVPDQWGIGKSESGWMCGSTFYEFMANIFNPWLEEQNIQKPVIFFLDGHRSHLTLHLSKFCSSNGIELIALYPNSTHILQPMDLAVFRPLKVAWRKEVSKWQLDHLGQVLKKEHFAPVLKNAISSISHECIRSGFRAGGLHPFGPDYIDMSKIKRHHTQVIDKEVDPKQIEFIKHLEAEIVKVYSRQKLELFNTLYVKDRNTVEKNLPSEDESLFVIWAKNKQESFGSERSSIPEIIEAQPSTSGIQNTASFSPQNEEIINQDDNNVSALNHMESEVQEDTDSTAISRRESSPPLSQKTSSLASQKRTECEPIHVASPKLSDPQYVQQSGQSTSSRSENCNINQFASSDSITSANKTPHQKEAPRHERTFLFDAEIPLSCTQQALTPEKMHVSENLLLQTVSRANNTEIPNQTTAPDNVQDNTVRFPESLNILQAGTPQKHPLEAALGVVVPSPFKKSLFWPEEQQEKKKRKKEKIPFAVTSKAWQDYHKSKEIQKQKLQEEKERRALERKEKKILKEKNLAKKKEISKYKPKPKDREDTTPEDTDADITYAESDDSVLNESDSENIDKNTDRQNVKRHLSPVSKQSRRSSKRVRKNQKCINSGSDSDDEPLSRFAVHKKIGPLVTEGQFVIVKYEGEYFPGKIESVDINQYEVSTMILSTGNSFRWPDKPDKIWYKAEDVVEAISAPLPLNNRGFFKIKEMEKYLPDIYNI